MCEKATVRWSVYGLEARKPVSRWRDSARAAIDEAIERSQAIQGGVGRRSPPNGGKRFRGASA